MSATSWSNVSQVSTRFDKQTGGVYYLLLETGDYLLQETGDSIYLETYADLSTTFTKPTVTNTNWT